MELDFEKTFSDPKSYATSNSEKGQAAVEYTYTYDETNIAVLCHIKDPKGDDDGEKPRGSCLICLAYRQYDIKDHVKHCKKMLASENTCPICLVECSDAHLFSHSHATTVEKFRLIQKNGGKVGLARAGALVIDLAGENIVRTESVYDLDNRLKTAKKPSPGGLAAYYLKSSLVAAASSKSDSKKLAENSAIVQTLLQVCFTCSAGHIPCVAAAKIAYTLNGYSIVELVGALAQEYPKFYAYQFAERECVLHKKNEKTIVFSDSLTSYNHTVKLLRILTGREMPAMVASPATPAKTADAAMDVTNAPYPLPNQQAAPAASGKRGGRN